MQGQTLALDNNIWINVSINFSEKEKWVMDK